MKLYPAFISPLAVALTCLAAAFPGPAGAARDADLVERDTLRRTLKFTDPADGRKIIVDNINGSIFVTGYGGSDVELVAYETIRAESNKRMERAKREVSLDIREEGDRIILYVDAPWRRADGSSNYRDRDHEGYDVEYEFELRVPSKTHFHLKTVNGEEINVRDMQGDFEVGNVNGAVDMRGIDGSGSVSTVNGLVRVDFAKNPGAASSFKTINGEIEVQFASLPSADFRFKTMNGEVYTDFNVTSVPLPATARETRRGKKVYGGGGSFMTRAGDGGPEISFSTLNGDMYLTLKGDGK